MSDNNYKKIDLTIDLKKSEDDDYCPPLLRRERNSDYGMFCEYFEDDVKNWFLHISNNKRIELIEQLAGMIKHTTIIDTPHPRRHHDGIINDLPPRLGRQSSIAPSKMESYPEDYEHDEEITPPKIRVSGLTPLQNESNDKFMDDHIFNVNMTRGSQPKDFSISDDQDDL